MVRCQRAPVKGPETETAVGYQNIHTPDVPVGFLSIGKLLRRGFAVERGKLVEVHGFNIAADAALGEA